MVVGWWLLRWAKATMLHENEGVGSCERILQHLLRLMRLLLESVI